MTFLLANWRWVVMGLLVAAIGIQTWRVDLCKKGRHEDKVSYEAKIVSLQASLQAQNEAIAKLGRESQDRKAKAEKGLQEATRMAQAARSEAERLRALAMANVDSGAVSACPAGDAVKAIREGLAR